MPYCPKCGNEVSEEMEFCPKCGAALKGEQPRDVEKWGKEFGERMAQRGREFGERMSEHARRRADRYEKTEVHEKHEFAFIGPLIGGLILIFLGLMFYLQVTGSLNVIIVGAIFFVVIGVIIIAAGIFAATMTRRRHPAP
ncbi:MAG TPA: zinc-ribbon domain-containing protein [Candidatus Krumholzibacteriaceae bacterium]|nr:zinc-ribbon domain-containing protein [Candidatus Krumholzibacteriaceae bacterium]